MERERAARRRRATSEQRKESEGAEGSAALHCHSHSGIGRRAATHLCGGEGLAESGELLAELRSRRTRSLSTRSELHLSVSLLGRQLRLERGATAGRLRVGGSGGRAEVRYLCIRRRQARRRRGELALHLGQPAGQEPLQ